MEVKGYDGGVSDPRPKSGQALLGESHRSISSNLPRQSVVKSARSDEPVNGEMMVARGEQAQDHQNSKMVSSGIIGNLNSNMMGADFEGILQDINKAISKEERTPDPVVVEIVQDLAEKNLNDSRIQSKSESSEPREFNIRQMNPQRDVSVDGVGLGELIWVG